MRLKRKGASPSFVQLKVDMRIHFLSILMALVISLLTPSAEASLPRIRTEGAKMVTSAGAPITLRGCNLGNWLLIEAWMLGWNIEDQETLIQVLTDRFGASEANRLMTIYRDGYIMQRDFDLIKSFGFNLVRLPFDSRMLIDSAGTLRPDAFKYLDRALTMAEQAGVYVIIDMHGAPGGQSTMDHTGKREQNQLWGSTTFQDQMVELWRTISNRYKDRTVVAAYDIVNEPYADFRTDVRPALRTLIPRCYQAIRGNGDNTIVIFPNALGAGITFYGDLKSQGYTQIGFTDHYYAGLFGSPTNLQSHAGMFGRVIPEAQAYLTANNAAMLIGEFNVVLDKAGGDAVMRRYFDDFKQRGWMATMWSYKLLKRDAGVQPDNWYLVTNQQALPDIDVRTSSKALIESYFNQLATMPLAVDEELKSAITSARPPVIHLPVLSTLPTSAPSDRTFKDWSLVDVNTATPAGLIKTNERVSIVTTGTDIFGTSDSFAFLQRTASPIAQLSATVDSLLESNTWAKAGLMVRFGQPGSSLYHAAPFAMVNIFTDGCVAFMFRTTQGGSTQEIKRYIGPMPLRLAMVRNLNRVDAYAESAPNSWVLLGTATMQTTEPARIGMITCSNSQSMFTRSVFNKISYSSAGAPAGTIVQTAQPTIKHVSANLLKDPPFTTIPAAQSAWAQWGNLVIPRVSGGVVLGTGVGVWQEIDAIAGRSYSLAIRVRRGANSPAMNLTLSLESTINGKQVAITDKTVNTNQIETGSGWSVLRVTTVAPYSKFRVLIRTESVSGADNATVEVEEARLWREDEPGAQSTQGS